MKFISLVAPSSWFGQASASQTYSAHVPRRCFETDMSYGGEHWRTKVSGSGQSFGALAFGFSGRPPCWGWDHVCFDALRSWHSRMVSRGGQNLVIDYPDPHLVYNDEPPTAVAAHYEFPHSNDVSPTSPAGTADA